MDWTLWRHAAHNRGFKDSHSHWWATQRGIYSAEDDFELEEQSLIVIKLLGDNLQDWSAVEQ